MIYDIPDCAVINIGWMSNRGRQNVASYLVFDLGVDWRVGRWVIIPKQIHHVNDNVCWRIII